MHRQAGPGRLTRRVLRLVDHRARIAALVGIVISGICVWILVGTVDLAGLRDLVVRADIPLIAAAVVTLSISMIVRTARWQVLLPPSGRSPRVLNLVPFVLFGYAANSVAPLRLGDAARALAVARRFRTGVPETLGSVALERVLDAGALAAIALVASTGRGVPDWLTQASLLLAGAAAAFCATILIAGTLTRDRRRQTAEGPPGVFGRVWSGLRANPRAIAPSTVLSAAGWCIDGVSFWLVAHSLGVSLSWEVAMLVAIGAAVGGLIPSAPAAIGTFELAGAAVAVALGLSGTTAVAIVLLGHAVTVIPLVIAGLVCAPIIGVSVRDFTSRDRSTRTGVAATQVEVPS